MLSPMRCRLCNRDSKVVASHIVPEFLYKALYDEKHRFIELSLKQGERDRLKQKGLREPLLCEQCEQKLSVHEDYMSKLMHGGVPVSIDPDGEHLRLSGLDYQKLKLFQLSILWRASVSNLKPFAEVDLGPHEAKIQEMLLCDEPGSAASYGCVMSALMNERDVLQGLVVPPTRAKLMGHHAYRFVFGGLVFVYVVTGASLQRFLVQAFAQPNGTVLLRRQQVSEMGFLMDTFDKLRQQGKLESNQ
jgi:hypothetical protein